MYDAIIRAGTVLDGLGGGSFTADVAIKDGRIAEIGSIKAASRETIDADGALVIPGFIDIHTHYDGQFLWDDKIDPSFSHGVTTAIAGNCGVGFAPIAHHRRELIELMEGVEDIPGIVLDEGLDWNWRSFPDYLDRLDARSYGMDVASHITHAPLRVFVMGERALKHEAATAEDIAQMGGLVREAMAAGAVGFSTGRVVEHRSSRGEFVPGTFADADEIVAMAKAMGESGHGVFQMALRGSIGALFLDGLSREQRIEEHRFLETIAEMSGRPVTYGILEFPSDPDDLFAMIDESERALQRGLPIYPQIPARGTSQINMLGTYHSFLMRPSYREIADLPLAERARAMREPSRRAAILGEQDNENYYAHDPAVLGLIKLIQTGLADSFVLSSPLDYEPGADRRVGKLAAAASKTPQEYIYDLYAAGAGENFNVSFPLNYVHGHLNMVARLFNSPNVMSGLADGGAHMKLICDASMPTFQLAFWSRDRARGECLPLELSVNKLTGAPAQLYGLSDRGSIEVGKKADINVIDHARLTLKMPHLAHDLPSGGARLLQESVGYVATLVSGVATRMNDEDTGARPGRLVRSAA